jgi:hypothetical protein
MLIFVNYTVDTYIVYCFYEIRWTILLTIAVLIENYNETKGKYV